jgi:wyosine [tRNA(Phe)-imidazoG37] synthetase (radical SAM superfamily)
MNLTFGPVNSRRFGISLGVDLSPYKKQCNFDCLYCELKGSKTISLQNRSIKPKYYIKMVKKALKRYPEIEVITITANGEPTLYPYLNKLVNKLNKIKKDKKLLILSNSGLIYKKDIQKILSKIDIVKLSLDCISKECFKKLDRLDKSLDFKKILKGIKQFSGKFKKDLILEILFVKNLNNKQDEIKKLYRYISKLNITRVDIGTIDRPPAYNVQPLEYNELVQISKIFKNIHISLAHKNQIKLNKYLNKNEILNLLDKRPQTKDDIKNLLNDKSIKIFNKLLQKKQINIKNIAGVDFYGV